MLQSLTRLAVRLGMLPVLSRWVLGRRMAAMVELTWKAAFRFRLFWVLTVLLFGSVVVLPLVIKDDGTARGFTQILLTYTLAAITGLLGFATLWLSCGALSRDIEEAQMQMVDVKPIARWQVWVGKWVGLMTLNAVLLAMAGASVYGLLLWRAQKLPEAEQVILQKEIFVARGSIKEPVEDHTATIEKVLAERLKEQQFSAVDKNLLRKQIEAKVKAGEQEVAPGYARRWQLELGFRKDSLRDEPLFMRVKFRSPESSPLGDPPTYRGVFVIGPPESASAQVLDLPSVAAETFHELALPPNLFDENGRLTIEFRNYNRVPLMFPLEEGMEVLYRESTFGVNFCRGLGIIWCWLGLIAAIGMCAGSFLSFPVAAFLAVGIMVMGLSSGVMKSAVEQGAIFADDHAVHTSWLDQVLLPVFKGTLEVIGLVKDFSPVEALSTGRSVTWEQLGLAFVQIVLLLGGLFAVAGILFFNRRELATAQNQS